MIVSPHRDIAGIGASSSTSAPLAPTFPDHAPKWFTMASLMLRSESLGETWAEAVSFWERFEIAQEFEASLKLGTAHRPPIVAQWIQRARSQTYRPEIRNVDELALKFSAWWRSLQPEWRVAGDGPPARGSGSWDVLRRSGANGLLSVMAALFFWGSSTGGEGTSWTEAVEDVLYALQELVERCRE